MRHPFFVYCQFLWIDLNGRIKGFEHLLFNKNNSSRILRFEEFIGDEMVKKCTDS